MIDIIDRWYSPAQAVRYSPAITRWLLQNYFQFLHQGIWPPKGEGGCEVRSGIPRAPHSEASAIVGELRWRLSQQGRVGDAIFRVYAGMETMKSMAHVMGWTEWGLKREMQGAFRRIWEGANPDKQRVKNTDLMPLDIGPKMCYE